MGYCDHYVVDGGKARIILRALVTPASIMDNTPILDLVDWVRSRWKIEPKLAVGDARYGTIPNIAGFEKQGIKAFLPHVILKTKLALCKPGNHYSWEKFFSDTL